MQYKNNEILLPQHRESKEKVVKINLINSQRLQWLEIQRRKAETTVFGEN